MTKQEKRPQTATSSRFFKPALLISLTLVVILIGIVSINLDSLREPIMEELSKITGLSIKIKSLNLSFSNGLSLRGGGLKVNSKSDSKQIFSAEELFLNAELEPLLRRQLKIKKIILVKPAMNIVLESKPDSNVFPDTSKTVKPPKQETPLQHDEVESSVLPKIPKADTNFVGSIRKILKHQNLSLRTVEVKNATLTIIRAESNSLPTKKIPVLIDARLDLSKPNSNQFDIDGKLFHLETEGLNFTGTLKAIDLLGEYIPLQATLESVSLPITKINILKTMLASLEVAPMKLDSGEVDKLFIHLEGLINPNHNPLKEVVMKSGFKISNLRLSIPGNEKLASITFPHIDGEGVWKESTLNYKINGKLWDGNIESNLVFKMPEALEGSFTGTSNSEIKLKELNLSLARFNLSDKWMPITGTVNGSINVENPMNKPSSAMNMFGKLLIDNLTLGSETPIKVSQATLNLQRKTPQQTMARVQIKDAVFNNFPIKTVGANLKIFPEKFLLTNGRLIPLNGVILFSGDYHPRSNTYIIRLEGKKIHAEDFLAKQIKGSGLLKGMFQGNLNAAKKIQQKGETVLFSHVVSSLSGRLSIQLKDGGISSSLVIDELSSPLNSASKVTAQKQNLNFNTLGGDFKIWEGKVVTDNFQLKGPRMHLAALMAANLVTGKLGGEIKVMPIQLLESIIKTIPLLGNLLTRDVTDIMAETYFRLGGTLDKPELTLGEGKTLFGKPASVLEDLVKTPKLNN